MPAGSRMAIARGRRGIEMRKVRLKCGSATRTSVRHSTQTAPIAGVGHERETAKRENRTCFGPGALHRRTATNAPSRVWGSHGRHCAGAGGEVGNGRGRSSHTVGRGPKTRTTLMDSAKATPCWGPLGSPRHRYNTHRCRSTRKRRGSRRC